MEKAQKIGNGMSRRIAAAGIIAVLWLIVPATAAMYTIENPAARIANPADKMYNPATQVNNPASNIYNPATRMDNPDPLSPPTQVSPSPATTDTNTARRPVKQIVLQPPVKPDIPQKSYYFKSAKTYIQAAKKAFAKDDYAGFISITEDALRRIESGTLKASKKAKQQLLKYKVFGYGLLDVK